MSAIRSLGMATRIASMPRALASRIGAGAGTNQRAAAAAAAAAFSVSAKRMNSDVIKENEVPVTVYGKGAPATSTIPVTSSPAAPQRDTITPLRDDVFRSLPPTMQKMSVKDKVIVVTGGARGLGNHMARACAEAGAKALVIFDANQTLGDQSAAELHQKSGLPVCFLKVDVRDGDAIQSAVARVVDLFGVPDVLVNSAGIADSNIKAETYDAAMFRRLIDINLTGSFLMSQAVGGAMIKEAKPGSIILVASMSGSIVNYPQEQSCYNASKAGVIQLAKSLAAEWAKYKIRVNTISPGYMDTELNRVPALDAQKKIWQSLTPQERLGDVDELNGLCVFLASDASSFMTGSNVIIDGGYTLY